MHTLSQRWGCLISRVEALAAEAEPVPVENEGGQLHHGQFSFKTAVHRVMKTKRRDVVHTSRFADVVRQAVEANQPCCSESK